jgi:major structural subunit of bundle-forming pilus
MDHGITHKEKGKTTFLSKIKRKERGYGIIEITIGLAAAALIFGLLFAQVTKMNENRKTNATMARIGQVQTVIQTMYESQSTYTGLTTAQVADSNQLPASMIGAASTVKHSFNDDMVISATAGADSYTIELVGLPTTVCTRLVSMDFGRGMLGAFTSDAAAVIVGRAMTPAEATAACSSAAVDVTWEFD